MSFLWISEEKTDFQSRRKNEIEVQVKFAKGAPYDIDEQSWQMAPLKVRQLAVRMIDFHIVNCADLFS